MGWIEESSGNASWWILFAIIERKSCYDTGAHFTGTGVARKGELYEWFKWISRFRIDMQWKIISRSQSASSRPKSSIYVEPRPNPATRYMEFVWDTGKRFWQPTCNARFITDTSSRNSSLYESQCHRWNPSPEEYRETCSERWRTIWKHNSNADFFFFARRPSTMSSLLPVEILQHSMVGQQRQQIPERQLEKFPALSTLKPR